MNKNAQNHSDTIIIGGIDNNGHKFRPSDWVERLASIISSFGEDQRLQYHRCAIPCTIQGVKSLVVDQRLQDNIPQAYEFIMDFAKNNNLRIQFDRRQQRSNQYNGPDRRAQQQAA